MNAIERLLSPVGLTLISPVEEIPHWGGDGTGLLGLGKKLNCSEAKSHAKQQFSPLHSV